jgi:hypothetical protein
MSNNLIVKGGIEIQSPNIFGTYSLVTKDYVDAYGITGPAGVTGPIGATGATGTSFFSFTQSIIVEADITKLNTYPYELLPLSGTNNYYEIDTVILEIENASYTSTDPYLILKQGDSEAYISSSLIDTGSYKVAILKHFGSATNSVVPSFTQNQSLVLTTPTTDPSGTGTSLYVKIYYSLRSFF